MFELIAPLLPRHPYEAASSIANDLFGPQLLRDPRGQPRCDLAYGTVSWPLQRLAELGHGFYGDVEQLLATRTLLNYGRCAMTPERFKEVRRRAIDGAITGASDYPYCFNDERPSMVCPLCVQEAMARYGTYAFLWPHQAAYIDGCWEHGVRLVRMHDRFDYREYARSVVQAAAWEVELARDVVRLCEQACGFVGMAVSIAEGVQEAGLRYANGLLCRNRLIEAYLSYARQAVPSPLLQALACNERAAMRIVRFLTEKGALVPPILLTVFLGFLREAGASVTSVFPTRRDTRRGKRVGTWSAAQQPKLRRPERHGVLALRLKGYSGAAVAAIKGMWPIAVHRTVLASGLQAEVAQAREAWQRRTARAAWNAACRRLGHDGVSAVVCAEPRAYVWLRKHDGEWLAARSIDVISTQKAIGDFRLPEQQARIADNLKDSMGALVEAGHSLPLGYCEVLRGAGVRESAFRNWLRVDERFANAMRPLFQEIRAPKVIRERLLALDSKRTRLTRTGET